MGESATTQLDYDVARIREADSHVKAIGIAQRMLRDERRRALARVCWHCDVCGNGGTAGTLDMHRGCLASPRIVGLK